MKQKYISSSVLLICIPTTGRGIPATRGRRYRLRVSPRYLLPGGIVVPDWLPTGLIQPFQGHGFVLGVSGGGGMRGQHNHPRRLPGVPVLPGGICRGDPVPRRHLRFKGEAYANHTIPHRTSKLLVLYFDQFFSLSRFFFTLQFSGQAVVSQRPPRYVRAGILYCLSQKKGV